MPPGLSRLAFAGADDQIHYNPHWGGVRVSIGEPVAKRRDELNAAG